jgi:PAS domain S-box-containing protein
MGYRSSPNMKSLYVKQLLVYFLLVGCMGAAGFVYYHNLKQDIRQNKQDELSAIAGLKLEQLSAWRRERMSDANFIFTQPEIAEQVDRLRKAPHSPDNRKKVLKWMTAMYRNGNYADMLVLSPNEEVLLSLPERTATVNRSLVALTSEAAQKKTVLFSGLYRGRKNDIRLDLVVPLIIVRDGAPVQTGSVVLRTDPARILFPLIQSWPTPSQTAETLIVRRDGDDVLFLNELRHKKNTALTLRIPVSRSDLPAAMGVKDETGVREGIDYRGVPVLADIRRVPDTAWVLVAKVDRDEIFKDLYVRVRLLGVIGVLLLAGAGLGTGYIWRKRIAEFYRKEYEAEQQKSSLMQRYEYLSKYANDIIIFEDDQGRILDANDRAVASYGYDRGELIGMNIRNIGAPGTVPEVDEQLRLVQMQNGYIYETVHRKKNGVLFPVEVSSNCIDIHGKKFIESIIRDVTERKKADEELKVSLRFLEIVHAHRDIDSLLTAFVSEIKDYTGCDAVGIRMLDEDGGIPYKAYTGFSQRFYDSESPLSLNSDRCMCINVIRGTADSRLPFYSKGGSFYINGSSRFLATVSEEEKGRTRNVCNREGYESVALVPFREGGRILGLIHVADHRENMVPPEKIEILEKGAMQLGTALQRVRAEDRLQASESRYRSLFENMLEGFAYCRMLFENDQPNDFIYLEVNNSFHRLTGLKDVLGKRVSEVIPGIQEANPELFEIYGRVSLTGRPERFETYVEYLGIWFSISVYSPGKEHFVAVFDNVSKRKQAEADLMRLNEELEGRVAERTGELEEKNAELERMNRLFVGRELKMIELKERLKELETRAGTGEEPE